MTESLPKARVNGQFVIHQNNEPLYKRAPALDDQGKPYADFMLLIPKLNKAPIPELKSKIAALQVVLTNYSEVIFVDLNMKINVLWVSFTPKMGLIQEIVGDIQARIPEAKLVSGESQMT